MPKQGKMKWAGRRVAQGVMSAVAAAPAVGPIIYGQKTVTTAGIAEVLRGPQELESGVAIKALAGNTGIGYVGDSLVDSTNGFELSAGEVLFLEINDLASVYVDVATNGDGFSYIGT